MNFIIIFAQFYRLAQLQFKMTLIQNELRRYIQAKCQKIKIATGSSLQLASVLSKMSQMFSQINSIYLQAMLNKDSLEISPQYSINTLFHQFEKECKQKLMPKIHHEADTQHEEIETKEKDEPINKKKIKQKKVECQNQIQIKVDTRENEKVGSQPPRPPPSSYLLFFNDHRLKIAEQFPNLSVTQLSKIASKCWRELTDEQKKPYHDRFNQEKQKYYEALRIYNQIKGQVDPPTGKKRGRKSKAEIQSSRQGPKISIIKPTQKQKHSHLQNNANEQDLHSDSSFSI